MRKRSMPRDLLEDRLVSRRPAGLWTAAALFVLLTIGFLAINPAGTAPAGAQSRQDDAPHRVSGVAFINGFPAPPGVVITAVIGGVPCGTGIVRQGGAFTVDVLSARAQRGCGTDGAIIRFFVGPLPAPQTIRWQAGAVSQVNLNVQAATPRPLPPTPPPPTPTPIPTPEPTAVPLPPSPEAPPAVLVEGWVEVDYVVTGETLVLKNGQRVQLYGIDAPEPGEVCGTEAIDALWRLLGEENRGYLVRVELGPQQSEGNTALAYLTVAGDSGEYLLDERMVWYGYAYAVPRAGQHIDEILSAQSAAIMNHSGCLWRTDGQA